MNTWVKDASERMQIEWDATPALADGDSVSTATAAAYDPSGASASSVLFYDTPSVSGNTVSLTLQAGTAGQQYRVALTVTTTNGETIEETLYVRVNAAEPWAVSAIGYTYDELRKRIARYLGYSRNLAELDSEQVEEVEDCLQSGLRQFYYPPDGYQWGFLRPVTSLSVGAGTIDLPEYCGGLIGNGTVETDNGTYDVRQCGESQIRLLRNNGNETEGTPRYMAVRPKRSTGTTRQRHELLVWPVPDDTYTIKVRMKVMPDRLTALVPYPLGVDEHAETILESCLSCAERLADDERGIHYQSFAELYNGSRMRDASAYAPDYYGYNGDRSGWARTTGESRVDEVTYIGLGSGDGSGSSGDSTTSTTATSLETFLFTVLGGRNGVVRNDGATYLEVSATSPASMGVTVATGYAFVNGKSFTLGESATLTVTTPSTNPRIDLVQAVDGGTVEIKQGTEAASPVAPGADSDAIGLATVYVRPASTTVEDSDDGTNGYITDARSFL